MACPEPTLHVATEAYARTLQLPYDVLEHVADRDVAEAGLGELTALVGRDVAM